MLSSSFLVSTVSEEFSRASFCKEIFLTSFDCVSSVCGETDFCFPKFFDLSGLLLNESNDVRDDLRLPPSDKFPVLLDFDKKNMHVIKYDSKE